MPSMSLWMNPGNTQISYPSPQDIPASEFQTSVIFDIWDPGTYTFVVVDRNNCFDISNLGGDLL